MSNLAPYVPLFFNRASVKRALISGFVDVVDRKNCQDLAILTEHPNSIRNLLRLVTLGFPTSCYIAVEAQSVRQALTYLRRKRVALSFVLEWCGPLTSKHTAIQSKLTPTETPLLIRHSQPSQESARPSVPNWLATDVITSCFHNCPLDSSGLRHLANRRETEKSPECRPSLLCLSGSLV
jgi:hypothetical protein